MPGGVEAFFIVFLFLIVSIVGAESNDPSKKKWPSQVKKVEIQSTADRSVQPALFYAPVAKSPVPLLVALHTWSGDYMQRESIPYAEWCIKHHWAFMHPDFRGPNSHPMATGSDYAIRDVIDAVDYAVAACKIDRRRIYLIGVSGGGYMALLMAANVPHLWAGVSSWVPIADLKAWYFESLDRKNRYAADIENSVGGVPESSALIDSNCAQRSPLTFLNDQLQVELDINAGIHDGHEGSVPVSHAMHAFNAVALPHHGFSEEEIDSIMSTQTIPSHLQKLAFHDPDYGEKRVLLRRYSNHTRLTLFEGGHEIVFKAGLRWLAKQIRIEEEAEENE